ncbi:hypothetical protein [Pseudactinotalea sp. HY158]|uniref:hypothetical protein n=1 Tax=Pseudactinotalea sp. HY158 TaxID=2654547 RepID=UPI00129C5631|nr:hypothetical protein [Pseudactinotalea sp. HY158]QGH70353.1 hypothetical protein GCE65_13270 [Pseudactinotalea sp. HY158]
MTLLLQILVILHMVGWAIVFGGAVVNLKKPKIATGMLHGILTAIIAGLISMGLAHAIFTDVNDMKYGIKLLIALIAGGMIIWGGRNQEKVSRGFLGAIAGLVLANIAIAVIW